LSKPKTRVIFGTDGVICIAKEKKEKKTKTKTGFTSDAVWACGLDDLDDILHKFYWASQNDTVLFQPN
jgi:hypothetical protein